MKNILKLGSKSAVLATIGAVLGISTGYTADLSELGTLNCNPFLTGSRATEYQQSLQIFVDKFAAGGSDRTFLNDCWTLYRSSFNFDSITVFMSYYDSENHKVDYCQKSPAYQAEATLYRIETNDASGSDSSLSKFGRGPFAQSLVQAMRSTSSVAGGPTLSENDRWDLARLICYDALRAAHLIDMQHGEEQREHRIRLDDGVGSNPEGFIQETKSALPHVTAFSPFTKIH